MELKEFLKLLEAGCNFLENDGYILRSVDRKVNNSFWYEKYTNSEGYKITFGWIQYSNEYHIRGLSALKRFNVIEEKIQEVIGGEITDYYTIIKVPSTEYGSKDQFAEIRDNNNSFILRNEKDTSLFIAFIKHFYLNECIPFFNRYQQLQTVYENYALLPRDKISSFIVSAYNTVLFRELVLKYLNNAPDKEEYYNNIVKELEPHRTNPTFNEILLNFTAIHKNLI